MEKILYVNACVQPESRTRELAEGMDVIGADVKGIMDAAKAEPRRAADACKRPVQREKGRGEGKKGRGENPRGVPELV